jgi:hypothetical protein
LRIDVARDAGSTGGLDVNLQHAIRGIEDRRLLLAGRLWIGHDLGKRITAQYRGGESDRHQVWHAA